MNKKNNKKLISLKNKSKQVNCHMNALVCDLTILITYICKYKNDKINATKEINLFNRYFFVSEHFSAKNFASGTNLEEKEPEDIIGNPPPPSQKWWRHKNLQILF